MMTINEAKKLTIILPVYNGWPFIRNAVDSILMQTYQDFLLIIVNDGSKDYTNDYLIKLKSKKIKVINKNHSGIIDSFNIALKMVETKYVARIDADDYYFPNKFEKQIDFLENNKIFVAVGTMGFYMSSSGKISKLKINLPKDHDSIIQDLFAKRRAMLQPSIVIRTNIIKKLNGYRKGIYPEDYDLYFRLGLEGKLHNIEEYLTAYRIHSSYSYKRLIELMMNLDKLREKYTGIYKLSFCKNNIYKINKMIFYNRKSLNSYLNGSKVYALFFMLLGLIYSPKRFLNYVKFTINEKV